MAHRRPAPSLLPPRAEPTASIDYDEVHQLMAGACWRKVRHPSLFQANRARGHYHGEESLTAYRCPFSSLTGGEHWHTGHAPTIGRVERIAAAVRWCAQHPDEVPVPQPHEVLAVVRPSATTG